MKTLQWPDSEVGIGCAQELLEEPKVNSATLEHYLHGLIYPAGKQAIINKAELNGAPGNVMAFFVYRLPHRLFRSASDISFTAFMSSYFFGQD